MVKGIILEEFQNRYAPQLVSNPRRQFFFYFMMSFLDLFQGAFYIADLEKTKVEPRFQQVRSYLHRRDRHHAAVYHIQAETLEYLVHFLVQ